MSGRYTPACLTAASRVFRSRSSGSTPMDQVERCPPASGPCTTSALAPAFCAASASSGLVTVTHASIPAALIRANSSALKIPKVQEKTAGLAARTASNLASHPLLKSGVGTVGSSRPNCRNAEDNNPASSSMSEGLGASVCGRNRLTPKTPFTSDNSCFSCSRGMTPPAKNPREPASAAALTNAGVDGPPAIGATITGVFNVSRMLMAPS